MSYLVCISIRASSQFEPCLFIFFSIVTHYIFYLIFYCIAFGTFFFFFFFGGRTGNGALCLQSRHSTAWPPVRFALVILEMGSYELFACAGLKLRSSWSQLPKEPGLQHELPVPSWFGHFLGMMPLCVLDNNPLYVHCSFLSMLLVF
jgi:hypothetical protein